MITIWGRTNSGNVQKAMWCLGELGLEHERIDIGGPFGGLDDKKYLRMNPNGKIPTLKDGRTVIWESNAIVRYLAAKYGSGSLWPRSPGKRSLADRWMDWPGNGFAGAVASIFIALVRDRAKAEPDMNAVNAAVRNAGQALDTVDAHLRKNAYMGGDALTIGDIPLGCLVQRWYSLPIERPDHPNVRAWHGRLKERPAYLKHVVNV
jgi:glutathione S-transferase